MRDRCTYVHQIKWGFSPIAYALLVRGGRLCAGIAEASCRRCGGLHTSRLSVEYSEQQCIEVLYGDTEADSTFWKGYQSKAVEVGFVSGMPFLIM